LQSLLAALYTLLPFDGEPLPDPHNGMDIIVTDAATGFVDPLMMNWDTHTPTGRSYTISYPLRESVYYNCSRWFWDVAGVWALREEEQCTPDTRRMVRAYIPASYENGAAAAVLFAGDDDVGSGCVGCTPADDRPSMGRPAAGQPGFWLNSVMLDRLIAAGRMPPNTVHITTNNANGRDIEMNTVSGLYSEFLQHEVLERVRSHPEVIADYPLLRFTSDPKGRVLMGCSAGGDQAIIQALMRPDVVGVGVAFSATVTWTSTALASNGSFPLGAADLWAGEGLIATGPKRDVRLFHSCAQHDLGTWTAPYDAPGTGMPSPGFGCVSGYPTNLCDREGENGAIKDGNRPGRNFGYVGVGDTCNPYADWADANNQTASALHSRGYDHRYLWVRNACHCDPRQYDQSLPTVLTWAFEEAW